MRPSEGRMSLWPVGVIAFASVIAILSITPTVKLRAVPPSDFIALRADPGGPKAAQAGEYWEAAVRVLQWKYNRTSPLPEQVPPEFRLAMDAGGLSAEDHVSRAVYWAKMREEWRNPENWNQTYQFDLGWMVCNAQSLSRAVLNFINNT